MSRSRKSRQSKGCSLSAKLDDKPEELQQDEKVAMACAASGVSVFVPSSMVSKVAKNHLSFSDFDASSDAIVVTQSWHGAIYTRAIEEMVYSLGSAWYNSSQLFLDEFGRVQLLPKKYGIRLPRNLNRLITFYDDQRLETSVENAFIGRGGSVADDAILSSRIFRSFKSREPLCFGRLNLLCPAVERLPRKTKLVGPEAWAKFCPDGAHHVPITELSEIKDVRLMGKVRPEGFYDNAFYSSVSRKQRYYCVKYSCDTHTMPTCEPLTETLARAYEMQTSYWAMFYAEFYLLVNTMAYKAYSLFNRTGQYHFTVVQNVSESDVVINDDDEYCSAVIKDLPVDAVAVAIREAAEIVSDFIEVVNKNSVLMKEPGLMMHYFFTEAHAIGSGISLGKFGCRSGDEKGVRFGSEPNCGCCRYQVRRSERCFLVFLFFAGLDASTTTGFRIESTRSRRISVVALVMLVFPVVVFLSDAILTRYF